MCRPRSVVQRLERTIAHWMRERSPQPERKTALTPAVDQLTSQKPPPPLLRVDGLPHALIALRRVPWLPLARKPPSSETWLLRTLITRSAAVAPDGSARAAPTARTSRRGPFMGATGYAPARSHASKPDARWEA